jgi:hypothetical protein
MRKIASTLMLLSAVSYPTAAAADSWTVGQQPRVLPADRFPVLGDGSDVRGGKAPYLNTMPADIPTNGYQLADFSIQDSAVKAVSAAQGGVEAKFRTVCGAPSHYLRDDPVLYPGMPGMSHLHAFFGNTLTNAWSTYRSLRTTGRSNCGGDVFNRTAYWPPAVIVTVGGKKMILSYDQFIVYYKNEMADSIHSQDIPRDFAYVAGPDPHVGYIDQNKAIVDAANAAAVAAGKPMRYSFGPTPMGTPNYGYLGVKCENPVGNGTTAFSPNTGAGARQPYLKDANGNPTLSCNPLMPDGVTPAHLVLEFNAPGCWDGRNGHGGPTGRGHVSMPFTATNITTGETRQNQCFDGWYRVPGLEMTAYVPIIGTWANFLSLKPHLSSDEQAGYAYRDFETGHLDWFGAWDYGTEANKGVMLTWMRNCTGTMGSTPRECDYSTIDTTRRLLSDSPIPTAQPNYKDPPGSRRNGRIVDNNHDYATVGARAFIPIPAAPNTIHAH